MRAKPKPRGRPQRPDGRTVRTMINLTPQESETIAKCAKRDRRHVAEWMRLAILYVADGSRSP